MYRILFRRVKMAHGKIRGTCRIPPIAVWDSARPAENGMFWTLLAEFDSTLKDLLNPSRPEHNVSERIVFFICGPALPSVVRR